MILKRELISIQDDPEKGETRVGKLRLDAIANAACRRSQSGADRRISEGRRGDRIQRSKPGRKVRLDAAGLDCTRVREPEQEAAGPTARLYSEGDRVEPSAGGAVDPPVPGDGHGGERGLSEAPVSPVV